MTALVWQEKPRSYSGLDCPDVLDEVVYGHDDSLAYALT